MGTAAQHEPVLHSSQHEAVLHSSPAHLAAQLAPRIDAALAADGVVVVALQPVHREALRLTLGTAEAAVEFADPVQVHSVPGFTVATRMARTGRRVSRTGGRALIVDQYVDGLPGCGATHWARLDIALNVVLVGLPLTTLCVYPVDSPELTRVHATHPAVLGGPRVNPGYRPPREALLDFPPPPPPDLGPPAAELRFGATGLTSLRLLVGEVAAAAGLDPDRTADIVLAVNEIASNSVEHGPGTGILRLWKAGAGGLVAEVTDTGGGMDVPFPGIVAPPPDGVRGRGLWLASELCDVLQVWSDASCTMIRVSLNG